MINDVKLNDKVLIPSGSTVKGIVAEAKRSGRVKGVAYMALRFNEIILPNGQSYSIQASNVSRLASTTHKRDALMIGGGAGAGALLEPSLAEERGQPLEPRQVVVQEPGQC